MPPDPVSSLSSLPCASCGTQLAPSLLSCPSCGALTRSDTLKRLAAQAQAFEDTGNPTEALGAWRQALDLLPANARQRQTILDRIATLDQAVDKGTVDGKRTNAPANAQSQARPEWAKRAGPFGALALFAWKFKTFAILLLAKGKFLLLGLTKASTVLSMLVSLGVYWTVFGWKYAIGLIASIYVHEMGHVAALRRYNIAAGAPMFIPGLGALVRLKQYPADAIANARVGLAGPIWGLSAAFAAYVAYLVSGFPAMAAIARTGAWINLFNLIPVWQLDGSRGFASMTRAQRWQAALVVGVAWSASGENLLAVVFIAAVIRALGKSDSAKPDGTALLQYALLIASLTFLATRVVPGMPSAAQ